MRQRIVSLLPILVIALGCCGWPKEIEASIIVDVLDANIEANSIGYVDVLISSGDGSDDLSSYGYRFEIENPNGARGTLAFVDPQFDDVQSSYLSALNYVFSGNVNYTPVETTAISVVATAETADASDKTFGTDSFLLARLKVVHTLNPNVLPEQVAGDQYSVNLVADLLGNETYFRSLDDTLELSQSSRFTGTVTIGAAVPEPKTVIILGLGMLTALASSVYASSKSARCRPA